MNIRYDTKNRAVFPFIVAPITGIQDTLILKPENIITSEDDFISKLYHFENRSSPSSITIRLFSYKDFIVLSAIITNDKAIEIKTDRQGLSIAIGVFIEKEIADIFIPSTTFLKAYMDIVDDILDIKLIDNDEGLLNLLQNLQDNKILDQNEDLHNFYLNNFNKSIDKFNSFYSGLKRHSKYINYLNALLGKFQRKQNNIIFFNESLNNHEVFLIMLNEVNKCNKHDCCFEASQNARFRVIQTSHFSINVSDTKYVIWNTNNVTIKDNTQKKG